MKLQYAALFMIVSMNLSSCAYMEGRKDQTTTSTTTVSGRVIKTQSPKQQIISPAPNPAQTASKIIAPIVQ